MLHLVLSANTPNTQALASTKTLLSKGRMRVVLLVIKTLDDTTAQVLMAGLWHKR